MTDYDGFGRILTDLSDVVRLAVFCRTCVETCLESVDIWFIYCGYTVRDIIACNLSFYRM